MAIGDNVGLLLRIKADSKQAKSELQAFQKDVKGATDDGISSFTRLSHSIGLTSDQASLLKGVATGIAAVATAAVGASVALFTLAKNASDFGSEINDAAEKSGLSAQAISAIKVAADQSGSSLTEVANSMSKFTKVLADAALGSTDATEKLIRLGLDPQQAHKDLEGSLAKVIKRIYEVQDPVAKGKLAIDAFGKSGRDLIPVINTTKGNFEEFTSKAKALGLVLSDESVAAADKFGDQLDELKAVAQVTAFYFAEGFMPAITQAMKEISGSTANSQAVWREWGETVGDIILRMTRGAKVALAVLTDLYNLDYNKTATVKALTENIDAYDSDRRRKDREAYLRDTNRPDWLTKQDKDIKKLGAMEGIDWEADEQKKAAEKALQEQIEINKRNATALLNIWKDYAANLGEIFDKGVGSWEEWVKDTGKTEEFKKRVKGWVDWFAPLIEEADAKIRSIEDEIATKNKATENERVELQRKQIERNDEFSDRWVQANLRAEQIIAATQKAFADRRIEYDRETTETRLKELEHDFKARLISEARYVDSVGILKLKLITFEIEELKKLKETAEIKQKIAMLDEKFKQQAIENSTARREAIERETQALIEWNKQYDARATAERPRYAGGDRGQPPQASASDPDSSGGVLSGILSHETVGLAGQITAAFSQMADAVGAAISAFVKFGSVGGSFRKFAAEMIASIASMAAVQAVWELAQGFAKLALAFFGHPTAGASATMHFTAAAVYGTIAAVAAVVGRGVAGGAFRQQTNAATGANTQGSRASGGAYSGQKDMTYEQSRNSPSGIGGAIVIRDKSGMFSQMFSMEWERNGAMRRLLQAEFGT